MNTIAVLTTTPNHDFLKFYSGFVRLGYRVFVFIDDNTCKFGSPEIDAQNAGVSLVQVADKLCRRAGYIDLNPIIEKKSHCAAWEKALYYFCCKDCHYENVWFIEDDVFVPNHEALLAIDREYETADIISTANVLNESADLSGWYWWKFIPKALGPPWAKSEVCAARLSRKVLTAFAELVSANSYEIRLRALLYEFFDLFFWKRKQRLPRKFFFIEFTFHTLALHNALRVVTPQALSGIVWRKDWHLSEMNCATLYHPVKEQILHSSYRKKLEHKYRWVVRKK